MIIPPSLKKLVAVFRGEVSPNLILLSVALGFWFGLTPGWYGVHVALLLLALVLNAHVGIFLMFAAIGKALCFGAAPALFHVGKWAQGSLSPVLDFFAALPVIGITDFTRYSVAGAFVAGPVLGIVCGLLLARSVSAFRRAWLKLEDNSEAFRKWHSSRWVRLLDWLLIGKRAQDVRAVLQRRPRIISLAGVVVAVVALAGLAIGLHYIEGERLTGLAAESLTKANGAEVNIAQLDLAVFSGKVSAAGVQITDPENPANNKIAVERLTADVGLFDLSRGRLLMDDIVLAGVEFDQPRASAGVVTGPLLKLSVPQFDPLQFDLAMADLRKLEQYFRNAEEAREWFEKLAEWLPERTEEAPPPPAPVPESYLEYLTVRAPLPPTPRMLVRRAVLEDVRIPAEQIGNSTITCTNLSDAPASAGLPVAITLESKEHKTSFKIVCRYDRPEGGAEISGTVGDVDLRELQAELNPNNPVKFEGGTATATISGAASRQTIDLGIQVQTQGMQAGTAGGGLFGLDPQVTSEALRVLENVQTTLRLVGPTTEPRLVFDGPALTNEFKQALVGAGKAELAR
ncbi:MAG: hypothetical protein KKI02_01645, partial [Planctomycetes bacterium]|nr:hypothetical protein [Planctomycetota bacterium]